MRQPLRADVSLRLGEIASALGLPAPAESDLVLTGVATDSRDVKPGDLFVALTGPGADGHPYVGPALEAGASALLVAREVAAPGTPALRVPDTLDALGRLGAWWRSGLTLRLVAITGSNGKTTTKEMLAAVLARHAGDLERILVTPGNFNNYIGVPLTLLSGRKGQTHGVVELGMNAPGEIDDLARLASPEAGVITNVAEAHLWRFDSLLGVAQAKAELWRHLGEGGTAIVPADDPYLPALAERHPGRRIAFGWSEGAEVRITRSEPAAQGGLEVGMEIAGTPLEITLPVMGRHHAANAAAAAAAAHALGLAPDVIAEGLAATAALPHRAQVVVVGGVTVLDDCYNANPASVRAAVESLRELPGKGRLGAILGDMLELGEAGPAMHRELGRELAEKGVSVVLGVGPLSAELCRGAEEGGASEVLHARDVAAAAQTARETFRAGDRVLLKGSRRIGLEAVLEAWGADPGALGAGAGCGGEA